MSCIAALLLAALLTATFTGCETAPRQGEAALDMERAEERNSTTADAPETIRPDNRFGAELDRLYLINPRIANRIEYRVVWQGTAPADASQGFKHVVASGDAVFTLDEQNFLTRFRRDNGRLLWSTYVGGPLTDIHGLIYLEEPDRIYVTTDSEMLVLTGTDGSQIARQRLGEVASTAPVLVGPHMVYGSRNGRLVWHRYAIGHMWRAYQVAANLRVSPLLYENVIVTVGRDGMVMALHVSMVTQLWRFQTLGTISARPAAGRGAIFVAGHDQYIRAFDAWSGATIWSYLTRSELRTSPVVIGDRVYQYIPADGIFAFEARPAHQPGGVIAWKSPDARGVVLTRHPRGGGRLILWDAETTTMSVLTERTGDIEYTVHLPNVHRIFATSVDLGEIYASDRKGRVIQLLPRE